MKTIEPTSVSKPLIDQWLAAKKAELAWIEHRRYLEQQIAAAHQADYDDISTSLAGLSTTVGLGELELQFSRDFEVDQAEAAIFMGRHPNLAGVVMRTEYKPVAKGALSLLAKTDELGQELAKVLGFKPVRVYVKG
jgi:hypothetical protein